jgi:transposase
MSPRRPFRASKSSPLCNAAGDGVRSRKSASSKKPRSPGMSVSFVARRAGIAPSQLFAWKRRMAEGGHVAVAADEDVVGTSQVRELEKKVRELERLLGKKTMEVEILREALDTARVKKLTLPLVSWKSDASR